MDDKGAHIKKGTAQIRGSTLVTQIKNLKNEFHKKLKIKIQLPSNEKGTEFCQGRKKFLED